MMAEKKGKYFNDSIHGYIYMEPEIIDIIDTPQFQRLRDLKQLGLCYFVWPGGSHNRFEHSIGVGHLAGEVLDFLQKNQPELEIDNRDIILTKIAGTCHDLGHGPFSHVFDNEFIPLAQPNSNWTHEQGSIMMLDHLVDANHIDIDRSDLFLIKDLIHRHSEQSQQSKEKCFLYDIVANSRNSVDVDKFDYILRDCHNLGIPSGFQNEVLMKNCRVIDNQICYRSKEVYNIYEMFQTRYSLFKRVYSHRVAKALEYMVCDAMLEADSYLGISRAINDPEQYTHLSDSILRTIASSKAPELKSARAIVDRIYKRQLYKLVDESLIPRDIAIRLGKVKSQDITTHQSANGTLRPQDIIVQNLRINYGMKEHNPVDQVNFFQNPEIDRKFHIPREKVTGMFPEYYEEHYLRVYIRDATNTDKIQAAQHAFQRFLHHHGCRSPNPAFSVKGKMLRDEPSDWSLSQDCGVLAPQNEARKPLLYKSVPSSPLIHATPQKRAKTSHEFNHQDNNSNNDDDHHHISYENNISDNNHRRTSHSHSNNNNNNNNDRFVFSSPSDVASKFVDRTTFNRAHNNDRRNQKSEIHESENGHIADHSDNEISSLNTSSANTSLSSLSQNDLLPSPARSIDNQTVEHTTAVKSAATTTSTTTTTTTNASRSLTSTFNVFSQSQ